MDKVQSPSDIMVGIDAIVKLAMIDESMSPSLRIDMLAVAGRMLDNVSVPIDYTVSARYSLVTQILFAESRIEAVYVQLRKLVQNV
jgi:hypothetical protein